jgi:hypothetical protein
MVAGRYVAAAAAQSWLDISLAQRRRETFSSSKITLVREAEQPLGKSPAVYESGLREVRVVEELKHQRDQALENAGAGGRLFRLRPILARTTSIPVTHGFSAAMYASRTRSLRYDSSPSW